GLLGTSPLGGAALRLAAVPAGGRHPSREAARIPRPDARRARGAGGDARVVGKRRLAAGVALVRRPPRRAARRLCAMGGDARRTRRPVQPIRRILPRKAIISGYPETETFLRSLMKIAQELRVGNVVTSGKDPMVVQRAELNTSGRNAAVVKLKLKNLLNGSGTESVYKADEKFEVLILDKKEVQYSYFADPMYVFM